MSEIFIIIAGDCKEKVDTANVGFSLAKTIVRAIVPGITRRQER